ncbi:tRNA pseudouridine38-40 synthase [Acididesulfobacillus acetoxydans]|uniref:tRNA pseudouridine synthase B n=1 Tax=Acididesulfobacillus acetoxydans TaxID=1561005 RepID=A0A8S0Y3X7_9FIRM|nr:tRNA pseudouridine(55) synthase TruB [Acididesulfobacillus acetoxydans]CAA7602535.1 tRNA pseudouridine38-40 synthase [Acididesulfobacillus acetoxydans]CEJ06514.1 tRNA pseudouridine synthase B [Acididesulfobacillus acetoxydans]
MDGVINLLKPPGMTSAAAVAWVKRALGVRKAGHTGTLDPAVGGVLPICLGKATRLAEYFTAQGKYYRAEATFGLVTDTQDAQGKILQTRPARLSGADLERILPRFRGKINQIPPMHSALRKEGKHLYEYARAGIVLEREARMIQVDRLDLVSWTDGRFPRAILDIECTKGTYVRTLCHDLGQAVGCGAHMSYLLRLRSGPFSLTESWTFEEIETALAGGDTGFLLAPPAGLQLPPVRLPESRAEAFRHGLATGAQWVDGAAEEDGTEVQVFSAGEFIGVGRWKSGMLYPHKVMS